MASAKRLVRTQADFDLLSTVVSEMARAWAGQDLTYCPHWSTFISQERWRDDSLPMPSADKPQRKAEPNCELPWLEVGE